jgi:hypothetical protein
MTTWYENETSACPECGHGPQWHDDPSGCTRMVEGWCGCQRVYSPESTGPDSYRGDDCSQSPTGQYDVVDYATAQD